MLVRSLWRTRRRSALALATLAVSLAFGCASGPALRSASLSASRVDASGAGSPVVLQYSLARPATVSIDVVGPGGQRYPLRHDEPRAPGDYEYAFDGTYPLPDDPEQRRTLPDGTYQLVVWHPYVRTRVERTVTVGPKGTVEADIAVPAPTGRLYANEVLEHDYVRYNVTEETKKEIEPMVEKQER